VRGLLALALMALLAAGLATACGNATDHDSSCDADNDCKVIETCCECEAVNLSAVADECDATCAAAGCHGTYGNGERIAKCVAGTCQHAPAGGDGGGRPDSVECGASTCAGGDVCIERPQPPTCENKTAPDDLCPADKPNDTTCGGAGFPCCCGDTPPSLMECSPAAECGDSVSCNCLTDECPTSMYCSPRAQEGVFLCEEPPAA